MRRALVLVLLLLASTAHAEKKRQTARLASGIGAGVAGGVTLVGFLSTRSGEPFNRPVLYTGLGLLFIAPSAGEFYAGQYLTIGMGIRAAATGLAVWTLSSQTRMVRCDEPGAPFEPTCTAFEENAYPLLGIAAIGFIGGVWYDVLDAADAADRYNKKHGFTAAPTVMPNGAPGAVIVGYF